MTSASFVQLQCRPPADRGRDLVDRGCPVEHLLRDAAFEDVLVRHEDELELDPSLRARARRAPRSRSAPSNRRCRSRRPRGRVGPSTPARRPRRGRSSASETRPRGSRAAPPQARAGQARHDVSVLAALAGANRVEEPGDHAAQSPLLLEREREELVEGLRIRVCPPLGRRRAVDALRVLVEEASSGDSRTPPSWRRRDRLLEAGAVLEYVLSALNVRK